MSSFFQKGSSDFGSFLFLLESSSGEIINSVLFIFLGEILILRLSKSSDCFLLNFESLCFRSTMLFFLRDFLLVSLIKSVILNLCWTTLVLTSFLRWEIPMIGRIFCLFKPSLLLIHFSDLLELFLYVIHNISIELECRLNIKAGELE